MQLKYTNYHNKDKYIEIFIVHQSANLSKYIQVYGEIIPPDLHSYISSQWPQGVLEIGGNAIF